MEASGDSPQKRGAAKRQAARKAAQAAQPTSSGTASNLVTTSGTLVITMDTGDSLRLLFTVAQEEDMLAVSRILRSIGRTHTVDVSPHGFVLTRISA
jgi:hypothetical protein